jgi:uncharacterized protein (TIGR02271 family)
MQARLDTIQAGWGAYDQNGERIGDIEEVGRDYVLVTKGLIFVKDIYIPTSAISEVDAETGAVHVNVDKDGIEDMGWDAPPSGMSGMDAGADDAYGDTYAATEAVDDGAVVRSGTGYASTDVAATSGTRVSDAEMGSGESYRVPLHEEELVAERRREQAGEVDVTKRVVEETQGLDVPVTREEVEVTRRTVDRAATGDEGAFTDGDTIRVPVTAERVDVDTQTRVVEEIEISKRPVTETQRVEGTVRREEVDVDTTGDALVDEGRGSYPRD